MSSFIFHHTQRQKSHHFLYFSAPTNILESPCPRRRALAEAVLVQDVATLSQESLMLLQSQIMTRPKPEHKTWALLLHHVVPSILPRPRTTQGSSTWPWHKLESQAWSDIPSTALMAQSSPWASGAMLVQPNTPLRTTWTQTTPRRLCTTAITMPTWQSGASTRCSLTPAGERTLVRERLTLLMLLLDREAHGVLAEKPVHDQTSRPWEKDRKP